MGNINNTSKTLLELIPLAKEQREVLFQSLEERKENEFRRLFKEISEQIKAASFRGESEIRVIFPEPYFHYTSPNKARTETVKALEKRGYKATAFFHGGVNYICIAW